MTPTPDNGTANPATRSSSSPPAGQRHDFTQGPLARPLALFCLPILAATVLQSLSATVNAAFVGRLLGAGALAAVTNANLILFLLLGVAFGLVGAASIIVSQAVGARDPATARTTIAGSAAWFALVSLAIAALVAACLPLLFDGLAIPAAIVPDTRAYLLVSLATIPATYLFIFATSMVRAIGDARLPLHAALASVGLDIALTPLLIVAGMGVAGSALATGIAQAAGLIFVLIRLYRAGEPMLPGWAEVRLDPAQLVFLVTKGVPMALQTLVIASAAVVLVRFVNLFGVTTVAAYGAASQIWSLAQMPAFAISSGLMVAAGQNIGAGQWGRVHRATGWAIALQLLATTAIVALAEGFSRPVMGLFTDDPATLAEAVAINRQVAWSFIVLGTSFILFAPLRAAGKVIAPLLVAVVALWLIRLPYVALLLPTQGANAIWQGIALGAALSIILSAAAYRHGLHPRRRPAPLAGR